MLRDEEIVGMLIGLLMAGQHTSSTTSAWLGFYLAQNKDMQARLLPYSYANGGRCTVVVKIKFHIPFHRTAVKTGVLTIAGYFLFYNRSPYMYMPFGRNSIPF